MILLGNRPNFLHSCHLCNLRDNPQDSHQDNPRDSHLIAPRASLQDNRLLNRRVSLQDNRQCSLLLSHRCNLRVSQQASRLCNPCSNRAHDRACSPLDVQLLSRRLNPGLCLVCSHLAYQLCNLFRLQVCSRVESHRSCLRRSPRCAPQPNLRCNHPINQVDNRRVFHLAILVCSLSRNRLASHQSTLHLSLRCSRLHIRLYNLLFIHPAGHRCSQVCLLRCSHQISRVVLLSFFRLHNRRLCQQCSRLVNRLCNHLHSLLLNRLDSRQ